VAAQRRDATVPERTPSPRLSDAEENVLEALGSVPLRGHEVAPLAGYSPDHVRRVLAGLVRRNLVVKVPGGYRRA